MECYLQYILQFTHNIHVYTLVILSILKISTWQITFTVYKVLSLTMIYSRSVQYMLNFILK
jgi:hypothetical protein